MTPGRRPSGMRALVIATCLAFAGAAPAAADVLRVGDKVAELDVAIDDAGKAFKLRSLKGKWVVLTVGASWCKPCKKELPTWDKMAGLMKDKAVFVAVNLDNDLADGKRFNKQLKLKNMKLVYMSPEKSAVSARYGADTMPTTFVFDPNGVVKHRKDGFAERDPDGEYKKFRAELDRLLRK
jgi:thiol-disulfide isomerase/thioredoxin